MYLNKPAKIILGILTLIPLLFAISTFLFALHQVVSFLFFSEPGMPTQFFSYLAYILPYTLLFFLLYLGLIIFYFIQIVQNKYFDTEKRFLWIVILLLLNGISMPVYWYVHIWKTKEPAYVHSKSPPNKGYESGAKSQ